MTETRTCQNCKNRFVIEPGDFLFYEKIQVPPPTWCPVCRSMRRLTFRNERSLYSRQCDLCKKKLISMFPAGTSFPVYCHSCYWSDQWDAASYAKDYDFSKPFFAQLKELLTVVPQSSVMELMNANSEYANYVYKNKHVYLSYSTLESENIFYSWGLDYSTDCLDCSEAQHCELCYECLDIERCSRSTHLVRSKECIDSHFLFDCRNCRNCFLSGNLRNREYVFKNKQYSKEEYLARIGAYLNGTAWGLERARTEFREMIGKFLHRYAHIVRSPNATGDNITSSKNTKFCFNVQNCEDLRYSIRCLEEKDSMDVFGGGPGATLSYECVSDGLGSSRLKFCTHCWQTALNIEYCGSCSNVSNCFGCIGLRKKNYCVLNKQCTKEEYESLLPKIIEHMNDQPYADSQSRVYKYGEFFPSELSLFAYNETIAQEYYPLTKAEVLEKGYRWKDPEPRTYTVTKTNKDLPDNIKDVDDSILNEVIQCGHNQTCNEQCTQAFKLIPDELQFYRRMNLPLPRLCPNCRHYQRLKQRNPMKLWHRKCQCAGTASENKTYQNTVQHFHQESHCPNEFETSYAPECPEIVYCEQCYNSEVV